MTRPVVICMIAVVLASVGNASSCSICVDVVGAVANATANAGCGSITPIVDRFCADVPPSVIGPDLCKWLVNYECPKIVKDLQNGKTPEDVCEDIGLCSSGACHSVGKDGDNGHCTAEIANSTKQFRLEWNALPWWKNKGCNPPKHFGIDAVYCSVKHLGCCLSGWTPHAKSQAGH